MLVPLQGKGIPGLGNSPLPLRAQTRQGGWDGSHRKTLILPFVVAGFSQFSGLDEEMMELVTGQNMYEEIAGAGVLLTFLVGMKPEMIFPTKVTPKLTKSGESHGWVFYLRTEAPVVEPAVFTVDSPKAKFAVAAQQAALREEEEMNMPIQVQHQLSLAMWWLDSIPVELGIL